MNQISPATQILAIQFKMQATDQSWSEAVRLGNLRLASRHQRSIRLMEDEIVSLTSQLAN
ncbi:hypothetical protein [Hyphomicrobium sp. ghe19]|uniref:hypothetical protein n=1 Tax=Hyphomicrobium sp. ghe19 TaxID=2682968 RepID=UPI001366E8A3|nr:hypothetical protein HYPP_02411 [Hyphomicrobium sp. ghe19]